MGDGWNVAGFSALNQPVQMTSFYYEGTGNWMWFGYDPLGRCVKRWESASGAPETATATYYYYDGSNLIQEGPNAATVSRTYVHGARVDEIVASATGGGSWLYHQYDARGHCIMLTNGSGGIQEQYECDAFGQPYIYDASGALVARNLGSPAGNRFLFTGREWLKELRVYDYRARLYQPELGRFVQPDPKQFEAGDYNLYRYCQNDPVNKNDPTGLADRVYEGAVTEWSDNYCPADRVVMVAHGNQENGAVTVRDGKTTGTISATTVAKDAIQYGGFSAAKNIVELSICESGSGGKDAFAQKVANALYKQTGVSPDVVAPDGYTANQGSKNDVTGQVTTTSFGAMPNPEKPRESGKLVHFTAGVKDKKPEK